MTGSRSSSLGPCTARIFRETNVVGVNDGTAIRKLNLAIGKVPLEPGNSGVQIKVKCCMLLEGHRPGRIVRFYPATWKVSALPHEEQFHGRE